MGTLVLVVKDLGASAVDLVTSVAKLMIPYYWLYVALGIFLFVRFYINLQRERKDRDKRIEKMRADSARKLKESINSIEI